MASSHDPKRTEKHAKRLAEILTVLQRCFLHNLSKELGRGKVSFAQYLLLGFLNQHPSLNMGEIAEKMGHTMAASTGLVDRIEKAGLAVRAHGTEDRRKICVSITAKGAALVDKVRADLVCNLKGIMEHLTPEEVEAWVHIYEKIFPLCMQKEKCE